MVACKSLYQSVLRHHNQAIKVAMVESRIIETRCGAQKFIPIPEGLTSRCGSDAAVGRAHVCPSIYAKT